MVVGWVKDASHISIQRQEWIPGAFTKSFFSLYGMKLPPVEERLPVIAYRCIRCGYLASYARPEQST
jgi:hypothetical protein